MSDGYGRGPYQFVPVRKNNCPTCRHAGWDPDGNYCAAPEVLVRMPHGQSIDGLDRVPVECGEGRKLYAKDAE